MDIAEGRDEQQCQNEKPGVHLNNIDVSHDAAFKMGEPEPVYAKSN